MKGLVWFLAGIGTAAAIAQLAKWRYVRQSEAALDLNTADREQLCQLVGDDALADSILENRPYRSKLDLVSRFVVPDQVYREIKYRIYVEDQAAHQAIGIA
jgi:hypothetical protein